MYNLYVDTHGIGEVGEQAGDQGDVLLLAFFFRQLARVRRFHLDVSLCYIINCKSQSPLPGCLHHLAQP